MKHRMFFAINLTQECRERFFDVTEELRNSSEPIKWEQLEKLHITTLFLGDVPDLDIINLVKETEIKLSRIENTVVSFNGIGVFPNMKNPKVIWIGIKKNEIIESIAETITSIAREVGIDVDEREFHPHVTLGRVKGNVSQNFIVELKTLTFEPFTDSINSVELMRSELDRFGSKYYIHTKFNLMEN